MHPGGHAPFTPKALFGGQDQARRKFGEHPPTWIGPVETGQLQLLFGNIDRIVLWIVAGSGRVGMLTRPRRKRARVSSGHALFDLEPSPQAMQPSAVPVRVAIVRSCSLDVLEPA